MEPQFSARELQQMFVNLTRDSGSGSELALPDFRRLVHGLLKSGTVIPLLRDADETHALRVLVQMWTKIRGFVETFTAELEAGAGAGSERDRACARTLRHLRELIEKELVLSSSNGTSKAVMLYRGLLGVILAHQASWLLADAPTPPEFLAAELNALQVLVMQRGRLSKGHAPDPALHRFLVDKGAAAASYGRVPSEARGGGAGGYQHKRGGLSQRALGQGQGMGQTITQTTTTTSTTTTMTMVAGGDLAPPAADAFRGASRAAPPNAPRDNNTPRGVSPRTLVM